MPYVDLRGDISLYYEHARPFDPSLPTLLVLSPYMHSLTLLAPLLTDPSFQRWNQVLLDLPYNGRGSAPVDPSYDHSVAGALVAFAIEALGLPACHIYAPEVAAFHTAVHLSVLFPECVRSLTFAGIYSLWTPQTEALKIFREIDHFIVSAHTEEDFTDGISALIDTCLGDLSSFEPGWVGRVTDAMGAVFVNRYNPRFVRYLSHTAAFRQPFNLRPEHLARITVPVLVMHGENDIAHSPASAHEVFNSLTGSSDRQLWIVAGAPHCVDLTHATEVTQRMAAFLAPFNSEPVPQKPAQLNRCKALQTLADITRDSSVLSRNAAYAQSWSSQSPSTLSRMTSLFQTEQARAAAYSLNIHIEGVSHPWETRQPGEWTYSTRHDAAHLAVQEIQAVRRASGGLVEVVTDTKVVKEKEPDWHHDSLESSVDRIELERALSGLNGLVVA